MSYNVTGTAGNDGTHASILGGDSSTDGGDSIETAAGNDLIFGNGGADTLRAFTGSNTVIGGFDADFLETLGTNDLLFGNEGNDTITPGQ